MREADLITAALAVLAGCGCAAAVSPAAERVLTLVFAVLLVAGGLVMAGWLARQIHAEIQLHREFTRPLPTPAPHRSEVRP